MIHVDLTGAAPFFGAHTPDYAAAEAAHRTLSEKTGAGSDFLGWTELPRRIRETELARILAAGKTIREKGDALVVVGIGGSYLGARAAYELIGRREGGAELLFAGNGLSAATLRDTIEKLGDRDFCVNVVSKSGTTLEPANFVTLTDDEGNDVELEYVDALEYNGTTYMAFFPVVEEDSEEEENEEEYGLVILKSQMENGEEFLVTVDDEEEIDKVYDLFMEQILSDEE